MTPRWPSFAPVTIVYAGNSLGGLTEQKPFGWEDAINPLEGSKIYRTVLDNTLLSSPQEKIHRLPKPLYLPSREEDYRVT